MKKRKLRAMAAYSKRLRGLQSQPAQARVDEILRMVNGREDCPAWIGRFLSDQDEYVRRAALSTVAVLGRGGREAYLAALNDPDFWVRHEAISGLGRFQHADDLPVLLNFLRSESSSVRDAALRSLLAFPDVAARSAVIDTFHNDPDARVRETAVMLLAYRGGSQDAPVLLEALEADIPLWLRVSLLGGLYRMGRRDFLPSLLDHLNGSIREFGTVMNYLEAGVHPDDAAAVRAAVKEALLTRPHRHTRQHFDRMILDRAKWSLNFI